MSAEGASHEKSQNRSRAGVVTKLASFGLAATTVWYAKSANGFEEWLGATGLGMASTAANYLSFRDGLLGNTLRNKLNPGATASTNRGTNTRLAALGIGFGSVFAVAGIAGAAQDGSINEVAGQPTVAPVISTPEASQSSLTSLPQATTESPVVTLDYPCELNILPDGDGLAADDSDGIRRIQGGLSAMGFEVGDIDGDINQPEDPTRNALVEFKLRYGFDPDQQITVDMCKRIPLLHDGLPNTP